LGDVPAGTYLITLDGLTVRKTFKIVKRWETRNQNTFIFLI
jgi:hypothetical protein